MATATEVTKAASPMGKPATPVAAAPVHNAATAAVARKGRKLVDPNETPEQAFKRLTEPRVTKALRAIQLLKNLSRFKPTDAHREKVFGTLKAAFALAESSWKAQDAVAKDEGFKL